MSQIRAAIFDLDGTLVDSLPATVDAFNVVIAPFLGTRLTAKEVRGVAGPNYRKILTNFLPADRVDAGYEKLKQEIVSSAARVKAFPGVAAFLKDLSRRGAKLAIATLRDEASVTKILAVTGLAPHFPHVLCGKEALGEGPGQAVDPDALRLLLAKLSVAAAETVFVCDTAADLESARKTGLKTAAVSWGYQRKEDLAAFGPDYLFEPLAG